MHICVLLNNDFTHDNRVKREVLALAQAGYQISLFALKSKKENVPGVEVLCDGRITVRRILPKTIPSFKVHNRALWQAFKKILYHYGRFDAIHVHDANMLPLGSYLSKIHFSKLIYDSHEYWRATFDTWLNTLIQSENKNKKIIKSIREVKQFIQFEEKVLKKCTALISVSQPITQKLLDVSNNPKIPFITLRNICESSEAKKQQNFHQHFSLPENTKILLYQGGITPIRGIPELLKMMETLERSDVVLILMGNIGKAYKEEFTSTVSRIFQEKRNVYYKEAVPSEELLSWTASADLGIHPILNHNLNHYYCLPNKVFEYLQAGLPQVVSDLPELGGLVKKYGIGFTFEPGNIEDMKRKVEAFFSGDYEQEQLATAIEQAKQVLNWETEQKKLIKLYDRVLPLPKRSG